MNTPLIEHAITSLYGERCREPEPGCTVCAAWHELDTLKAKSDHYTSDESVPEKNPGDAAMNHIKLNKRADGYYHPNDDRSRFLMQHCVNTDLSAVNDLGLEKLRAVSVVHGWSVEISPSSP